MDGKQPIEHKQCLICGSKDLRLVFPVKDHSISQETFDVFACSACTFRFTQNIPAPSKIGAYYQSEDYVSHSDTRKGLINRLYHWGRSWMLKRKFALIEKYAKRKHLLDVGSGTGYFLNFMRSRSYGVLGIEMDEGARNYSREQFKLEVLPPQALIQEEINDHFGVITMWHVLEHVHAPDQYLQRLHQLLDEDGTLLIAVPNYQSLDGRHYKAFWAGYDVPRHLWHFSPDTIRRLAERNGFSLLGYKKMVLDPFYVSLLSEKYKGRGILGLLFAAWIGLRSHLNSLARPQESSSLIYIFQKTSD